VKSLDERERRLGDVSPAVIDRQRVSGPAIVAISVTPSLR
jgi:hypothetical protein